MTRPDGTNAEASEAGAADDTVDGPGLHRRISALAGLLGTWRGEGAGHYPTIADFAYVEEVTFGHVGKPFLSYAQKTKDAATGQPLHAEAGYVRPGPRRLDLELVVAQPSGIVEVHTGALTTTDGGSGDGDLQIVFTSEMVATTMTAKSVIGVERQLTLTGDELTYDVSMEAVGKPFQHHLHAVLHRVATD